MIRLQALTLLLTIGGVALAIAAVFGVVALPIVLDHMGLGAHARLVVDLVRWPLLLCAMLIALCVTYRVAPSRDLMRPRWISAGAVLASVVWLLASIAFSFYVESFGVVFADVRVARGRWPCCSCGCTSARTWCCSVPNSMPRPKGSSDCADTEARIPLQVSGIPSLSFRSGAGILLRSGIDPATPA